MPVRAPRICGCGHRVASGQLCTCQRERQRLAKLKADRNRPNARARGYTHEWDEAAKAFLALPGNERCACGCGRSADMVDHKVAHKGNRRLFWDRSNWQPMHHGCNTRKAIRQEGGFGNRIGGGRPQTFGREPGPSVGGPLHIAPKWGFEEL